MKKDEEILFNNFGKTSETPSGLETYHMVNSGINQLEELSSIQRELRHLSKDAELEELPDHPGQYMSLNLRLGKWNIGYLITKKQTKRVLQLLQELTVEEMEDTTYKLGYNFGRTNEWLSEEVVKEKQKNMPF